MLKLEVALFFIYNTAPQKCEIKDKTQSLEAKIDKRKGVGSLYNIIDDLWKKREIFFQYSLISKRHYKLFV